MSHFLGSQRVRLASNRVNLGENTRSKFSTTTALDGKTTTLSSTKVVIIDDHPHQNNHLHNNFTTTETNHIPLITTLFNELQVIAILEVQRKCQALKDTEVNRTASGTYSRVIGTQ